MFGCPKNFDIKLSTFNFWVDYNIFPIHTLIRNGKVKTTYRQDREDQQDLVVDIERQIMEQHPLKKQ